jgi:glutamate/tyrosine decarboxylase-like PLP-dependent enzyme
MIQDDPLSLPPDEMRRLGRRVVDLLVDHWEGLADQPAARTATRPDMARRLVEDPPETGRDPDRVLDRLETDVLPWMMHTNHPRFLAFVPSPSNFVSVLADALCSGYNIFSGTWMESAGPTQVELLVVDWLRRMVGLPDGAGGVLVSGGSMANATAMAAARHIQCGDRLEGARVYFSDQTHSSVIRGLWLLGLGAERQVSIPSGPDFRLEVDRLRAAVDRDRSAGRRPFLVAANAGTTNTGAVDPLDELADYCRQEGLWLHVDGAFGAAAAWTERGRRLLTGLARADSVAIDPHKWLFQPYEIGCVLVRREEWLSEAFRILPEYLADIETSQGEVNFCDRGVQLTRMNRALKLWLSIQIFGAAAFRDAINRGMELAEILGGLIDDHPDWTVVTRPQMSVVTFRRRLPGRSAEASERFHRRLVEAVRRDGRVMVATTMLKGDTVLRACTINPRTTEADLAAVLQRLDDLAAGLEGGDSP